MGIGLLIALAVAAPGVSAPQGRKVVSKPSPQYPDIARKMNLTGVVKIEVTVGVDGQVKFTKVLGGHPLLVDAALKALKDWKFAPGSSETTEILEFKF